MNYFNTMFPKRITRNLPGVARLLLAAFLLAGCGKKDPGSLCLAVVSKDTLRVGDLVGMKPAESDSVMSDSLRSRLVQDWIDCKLALRNVRERGLRLDSTQAASIRHSIKDSSDILTVDRIQVSLFLPEIQQEMMVSNWEVSQFAAQEKKAGRPVSLTTARCVLERKKVAQWLLELRSQGGFKIMDPAFKSMPPSLEFCECDSVSNPASLMLEQAGPKITNVEKIQNLFSEIHSAKADMDMGILAGLEKLEERLAEPKGVLVEKESRAHLYRSAESVQKVIAQHFEELQKEFKRELKRNPNLQGQVIVRFVINERGAVDSAALVESEISDEQFLGLLLSQVRAWEFGRIPAGSGGMAVNFPFKFEARQ